MSLRLIDVTLRLGDADQQVTALDGVSLEVPAGELVAVAGPSGSGKSSLLAVAGALIRPSAGRVLVGDVDLTELDEPARARLRRDRIGFVFQSANLLPSLTAVEQLLLPLHLQGRRPRDGIARAHTLLEEVGMGHRSDRRPHQLSGGERQRIGIARALMVEPRVLLVDEPTSALDRTRGREVVELLARETRRHGVATVMVTHDEAMLDQADRITTMRDGVLRAGVAS
jgi:putative ABC transport system ATP-binding protein